MTRVISIVLVAGILACAMHSEILARGGGGGGGGGRGGGGGGNRGGGGANAARSGGGFSPSASGSRPSGASASARPSSAGGQKAAARPAGSTAGAKAGTQPGRAATGQAAGAGQRSGAAAGAAKGSTAAAGAASRATAGSRPSSGQLNSFLDVSAPAAGAAAAAGAARGGGAAADFLQGGAPQVAAGAATGVAAGRAATGARVADAGRPGTPGQNLSQNRPGRIEDRGERQGERDQRRDEIRNQYNENNPGSFWEQNPGWAAFAVTRPLAWATWGSVGSWCGYGGQPTSYNYGEDVYYSGDQVYSGDQPVATADEYADQAAAIASSAPSEPPKPGDLLPLGVFAVTQDGEASGAEPSIYMQLAISKQGVISGTMKNTLTDKIQPLEGMADKKSQRVAWGVKGQDRPIMETGLSNLTQDTSPALVHFADGQTQQWLMVRIPEPKQ